MKRYFGMDITNGDALVKLNFRRKSKMEIIEITGFLAAILVVVLGYMRRE